MFNMKLEDTAGFELFSYYCYIINAVSSALCHLEVAVYISIYADVRYSGV